MPEESKKTEVPVYMAPEPVAGTLRDPNTGRLCFSESEFATPEQLKKLEADQAEERKKLAEAKKKEGAH